MAERQGIMLPYAYDPVRVLSYPKPWLVQPKLEGDRCRDEVDVLGETNLLSSGLTSRNFAVPFVVEELKQQGLFDVELDGELFVLGKPHDDWIRPITSRTKNLHPDTGQMEYHIFDLVNNMLQQERLEMLRDLVVSTQRIKLVPTYEANSLEEMEKYYHQFLDQGYEGIIIRHPEAPYVRRKVLTMTKLKPRLSETYEVIGYEEEISIHRKRKGTLGALTLKDAKGESFKVGSGFTAKQREDYWDCRNFLIGCFAKIRFQSLTTVRQVPKMQSFVELIKKEKWDGKAWVKNKV